MLNNIVLVRFENMNFPESYQVLENAISHKRGNAWCDYVVIYEFCGADANNKRFQHILHSMRKNLISNQISDYEARTYIRFFEDGYKKAIEDSMKS